MHPLRKPIAEMMLVRFFTDLSRLISPVAD